MSMKEKILSVAQRLIQQRGVNGFSYADIAKELGIAKASLHHHFATKAELVDRLLTIYTESLQGYLVSISVDKAEPYERIKAYTQLYRSSLDSDRACVGGMLSAEAMTLQASIHPRLQSFFDLQKNWIVEQLEAGSKDFQIRQSAGDFASMMIAALQGALIVSRSAKDHRFFEQTEHGLLASLRP